MSIFRNKSVFVTGHTGFKGSWLCHVLDTLGARVTGYSLEASPQSHFNSSKTNSIVDHYVGDILDADELAKRMVASKPNFVFHLAAQPYVLSSYERPLETISTNVLGTANVLAAAMTCASSPAIAIVTSDKCYENTDNKRLFSEGDRMGGDDPYSASKAAAELVSASYARSFLIPRQQNCVMLRGGNVIGGGDYGTNRLVVDIIDKLRSNAAPTIRHPNATRPWQFVLDALFGYIRSIEYLVKVKGRYFEQFNIGPPSNEFATVAVLSDMICEEWTGNKMAVLVSQKTNFKEKAFLGLDVQKAMSKLDWSPKYDLRKAVKTTVEWYKEETVGGDMMQCTRDQIIEYMKVS